MNYVFRISQKYNKPINITDVINRFPKIKSISNLPLKQRWYHIIRLPQSVKEEFVKYANHFSVKSYEGFLKIKQLQSLVHLLLLKIPIMERTLKNTMILLCV